ncbi:transporter substrate-binding domain-containing protein [Acidovorax sp.]|uniref:transporter substrate-binding domain-containing protein n=1 Tax=Acidovorax sp. TaxID=1872122 RepID=UPI003CFCC72E
MSLLALAGAAHAQDLTGTLKKIQETGQITLATRGASVPFNYLDDNSKQAGFAWEISLKVADKVRQVVGHSDLKVRNMEVTPQTRIPLVANQTVDLECSSTTHNQERENQVGFSVTYFAVGARIMARAESAINDWKGLAGKNVVVGAGTTTERLLRQLNEREKLNINIIMAPDINEGSMSVESGRAEAFVADDTGLFSSAARARNPARWKVVGEPLEREAYGCMLRKGDVQFKKLVDDVIVGMMKNGEMTALYEKYFTKPLNVRNGFNMQMPMQPAIRDLYQNPSDKAL